MIWTVNASWYNASEYIESLFCFDLIPMLDAQQHWMNSLNVHQHSSNKCISNCATVNQIKLINQTDYIGFKLMRVILHFATLFDKCIGSIETLNAQLTNAIMHEHCNVKNVIYYD